MNVRMLALENKLTSFSRFFSCCGWFFVLFQYFAVIDQVKSLGQSLENAKFNTQG